MLAKHTGQKYLLRLSKKLKHLSEQFNKSISSNVYAVKINKLTLSELISTKSFKYYKVHTQNMYFTIEEVIFHAIISLRSDVHQKPNSANSSNEHEPQPQNYFILHSVYRESTATLTSVKKMKNFTKIKLKELFAGDNLRKP